ncbi:MAG: hypothetical protein WAZ48_13975 [Lysobacteraceae bacterium]
MYGTVRHIEPSLSHPCNAGAWPGLADDGRFLRIRSQGSRIARLLQRHDAGDREAFDRMVPLVRVMRVLQSQGLIQRQGGLEEEPVRQRRHASGR